MQTELWQGVLTGRGPGPLTTRNAVYNPGPFGPYFLSDSQAGPEPESCLPPYLYCLYPFPRIPLSTLLPTDTMKGNVVSGFYILHIISPTIGDPLPIYDPLPLPNITLSCPNLCIVRTLSPSPIDYLPPTISPHCSFSLSLCSPPLPNPSLCYETISPY